MRRWNGQMAGNIFTDEALSALAEAYPVRPAKLTHGLLSNPLLDLEALVDLAAQLPTDSIEYNPGKLPIGIRPEDVPAPDRSPVETIRAIEQAGAWMVLKRIEQVPAYEALLETILADLAPVVAPRTGEMLRREGFVFISSPGSVTPFHFDPEHNVLLQVRGRKTLTAFPTDDETLLDPRIHEAFHLGRHHRNLPWQDAFAACGTPIALEPGEAVHVPVKAPHWVQNGPDVSISLSVTWRSQWSCAEADARAFNHLLRGLGITPKSPAPFPARNQAKSLAYRTIRKLWSGAGNRAPLQAAG
jgi:quercetin dioxygenase-like cupin family protein